MIKTSIVVLFVSACGGGDGEETSSSTLSGSAIPNAKQVLCGGQSCVEENGTFASSLSTQSDAMDAIVSQYQFAQRRLEKVNTLIDGYNELAAQNGITSCDEIPDSHSMVFGPSENDLLTISEGDVSFDLGDGLVSLDHKIIRTEDGIPSHEFQIKCVNDTEAYVYLHLGINPESGIEQAYFHYTETSNVIEYVFKSDSEFSTFFRFEENSSTGEVFFVVVTDNGLDGLGNPYYTKSILKNIEISTFPSMPILEVAFTKIEATNLDSVSFGINGGNGDVRTCVYNPQNSPLVDSDPTGPGSDCDESAPEALVPATDPLLGTNGSKTWDKDFLNNIVFPAID